MTPDHPTRRLSARRLRELRFKKGWSQETLAARAGLHRTYISGIERLPLSRIPALRGICTSCTSERNIGLDNVERLADAFRLTVSDLLDLGSERCVDRKSSRRSPDEA